MNPKRQYALNRIQNMLIELRGLDSYLKTTLPKVHADVAQQIADAGTAATNLQGAVDASFLKHLGAHAEGANDKSKLAPARKDGVKLPPKKG